MGWAAGGETPRGRVGASSPVSSWSTPSETVLEARVMYNHGGATPAPRLLIKPNLSRLFCIREQNYAVVMRGAQRLLCDTTPAALESRKKKKAGKKTRGLAFVRH